MSYSYSALAQLKQAVVSNDTKAIPDLIRSSLDLSKINPIPETTYLTLTKPLREEFLRNPLPFTCPTTPEHWKQIDNAASVFATLTDNPAVLQQVYKRVNDSCTLLPVFSKQPAEPKGYTDPKWLLIIAAVGLGKKLAAANRL